MRAYVASILKASERFTKTDMTYLTKGGFWLMGIHSISMLTGLIITVVLANMLSKQDYGTYTFILSLSGLLAGVVLPGMITALTVNVAKGNPGHLRPAFRARVLFGLLGSALALLGASYYFFIGQNMILASSLVIIAIALPFLEAPTIYRGYFNGTREFKKLFAFDSGIRITASLFVIISVFLTKNLLIIIATYFVSYALLRLAAYIFTARTAPRTEEISPSETTTYGKHLSAMGVFSIFANHLDKILIFQHIGAAEAAAYTLALLVPDQARGIFRYLTMLALPKFALHTGKLLSPNILYKMGLLGVVSILLLGAYILIAPLFFAIFFPTYPEAVLPSQIIALGFIFFATLSIIPATLLRAQAKTKLLYVHTIVPSTIKIVLLLILVPLYGIWGAVISVVLHQIIIFTLSSFLASTVRNLNEV